MIHTQKVAISMPEVLVKEIDALSKRRGLSRSRYITQAVSEKIEAEKKRFITKSYDKIFLRKAGIREIPGRLWVCKQLDEALRIAQEESEQ